MTKKTQHGFSLIELSVALVIVGLLVGGAISGFATFQQNRLISEAQSDLKNIKSALIGYMLANRRLPCPDIDGPGDPDYGLENNGAADGNCEQEFGWLPHLELGVRSVRDPWGGRYLYRVDTRFADSPPASEMLPCSETAGVSFTLCHVGEIEVHDAGGFAPGACAASPDCNVVAQELPVLFLSLGLTGPNTDSVDERANIFGNPLGNDGDDEVFVVKQYTDVAGEEFDDQVSWISAAELKTEMVRAGWLP